MFYDENAMNAVAEYWDGIHAKEREGHQWTDEQRMKWIGEVASAYELDPEQLMEWAKADPR